MSEVRMVLRGESRTHRFLRARLTFLIAATLAVDAVATVAMYMLEHNDPRSGFDDVGGALFWVSAQLDHRELADAEPGDDTGPHSRHRPVDLGDHCRGNARRVTRGVLHGRHMERSAGG